MVEDNLYSNLIKGTTKVELNPDAPGARPVTSPAQPVAEPAPIRIPSSLVNRIYSEEARQKQLLEMRCAWIDTQTDDLELRERLKSIVYKAKYLYDPKQARGVLHGWTHEQILERLVLIRGYCELRGCDLAAEATVRKWCIDFNRKTDKARGIVCNSCNVSLPDEGKLEVVIRYLIRHGELEALVNEIKRGELP